MQETPRATTPGDGATREKALPEDRPPASDGPVGGPLFVAGNSRSGTTVMGRILGRHPSVFTLNELHFFEQLWSPADDGRAISEAEAARLAARLICIQRDGYLNQGDPARFREEAESLVASVQPRALTSARVFEEFLLREAAANGKAVPCDQTPRNVFYIGEILRLYPGARVINMVRDPRDVLLSQKRKWKRHYLGDQSPPGEALRSWVNYHPVTISKLWGAAIDAADRFDDDPRVRSLRFEGLLADPDGTVREACEFAGMSFDEGMLEVPQVGSSSERDRPDQKGINRGRAGSWQKGGLSPTEVYLCQRVVSGRMRRYGYPVAPIGCHPASLGLSLLSLPVKLALALLLNMGRMRDVRETIKRRLA